MMTLKILVQCQGKTLTPNTHSTEQSLQKPAADQLQNKFFVPYGRSNFHYRIQNRRQISR